MSTSSLTYQQSISKHYHSGKHFSELYLHGGGKNQLEQNYVTAALCVCVGNYGIMSAVQTETFTDMR